MGEDDIAAVLRYADVLEGKGSLPVSGELAQQIRRVALALENYRTYGDHAEYIDREQAGEKERDEARQRAEQMEAALRACIEGRTVTHGDMPVTFDEVHQHSTADLEAALRAVPQVGAGGEDVPDGAG